MKVKMLRTAAGPQGCYGAGHVVDLSDEMGRAFIACGAAQPIEPVLVVPEPIVETATAEPDEVRPAMTRKGRGGRR